jgi:hypothetical protein
LEYLHTRQLTAAGLRDVLRRVSEVEGLFPTKEALGDALCRGPLRYRNFSEEGIQNIYNGWTKSTQRMYCNGWDHFAVFLLEGTAAEIGNLQNINEVYWLYGQFLYWLLEETNEYSNDCMKGSRIKLSSLDNIKSAVNMYFRLMFNVNAFDCDTNRLISRGLSRKNPKLPKYKLIGILVPF